MSPPGPTLPICAVQQVDSYQRYIGRHATAVSAAALSGRGISAGHSRRKQAGSVGFEITLLHSTSAMDHLEHVAQTARFPQLCDRFEQCASRKFLARAAKTHQRRLPTRWEAQSDRHAIMASIKVAISIVAKLEKVSETA
jgi:hypothetical protein